MLEVIHLDTIVWRVHPLPQYGSGFLPKNSKYTNALDAFKSYFVNHLVNYHAHKLLQLS